MELINAKELRVGNTICIKNSDEEYNPVDIEARHIKEYSDFNDKAYGIPLTHEVMEKFRFKKDLDGNYSLQLKSRLELYFVGGDIGKPTLKQDGNQIYFIPNLIASVHQLQNFVFANTGEELMYNHD